MCENNKATGKRIYLYGIWLTHIIAVLLILFFLPYLSGQKAKKEMKAPECQFVADQNDDTVTAINTTDILCD